MLKSFFPCADNVDTIQKRYIIFLLFIACVARICIYFYNRDLWLDELYLAESLQKMDTWALLTQPLLNLQSAPLGFLLASKFLSNIFFNSYMLHLVPLISGISLIFISYKFMEKNFDRIHSIIYMSCFTLCVSFIYYSIEFKQYMTEALVSFYIVFYYIENKKEICANVSYTFLLLLCVVNLFSSSIPFTILGIACAVMYKLRTIKNILSYIQHNAFKITIFIFLYICYFIFYLSEKTSIHEMQIFWEFSFLPLDSSLFLSWFKNSFLSVMGVLTFIPVTIKGYPLGGIFFVIFFTYGTFLLFKTNKDLFFCTVVPLCLVLFASTLKMYPIGDNIGVIGTRFMLFLFPLLLIPLTVSMTHIMKIVLKKNTVITLFLTIPVTMALIVNLILVVRYSEGIQESQKIVSYINNNYTDNTKLLIWHEGAIPAYHVYSYGKANEYTHFTSKDDLNVMVTDFLQEKKVVMIFYSHFFHKLDNTINSLHKLNLQVIRIRDSGVELLIVSRK